MHRLVSGFLVAIALAGCSSEVAITPTITEPAPPTTTTTPAAESTTSLATIESCDDVPYRPLVVPDRATGASAEVGDFDDDPYLAIPGTTVDVWVDGDGLPVVALIRGALPPEPWAGPTARVEVAREDGALGPLADGVWAVAWFESDARCDLYTLVVYPPTSANEALEVADSVIPTR